MAVKVADMTVDELRGLVRQTVEDTLMQWLGDPDVGLELQDEVRERLRRSIEGQRGGAPTIPAEEVASRLGLRW